MSVVYSSCWKSIAFVFWRFPRPVVYSYFDEKLRLYFDASPTQVCEDEFSWAEPGHSCYYTKNNIRPRW